MEQKSLKAFTDQELLQERKKLKKAKVLNAVIIGFMAGIIVYSLINNTWGLLTLVPLYFIYKLVCNSKKDKELEELLKERNLN